MRNRLWLFTIAIAGLILFSCNKKWDKTMEAPIKVAPLITTVTIAGQPLTFESIRLNVEYIKIDGERIQSYAIDETNASNATIDLINGSSLDPFLIPQGTYTSMNGTLIPKYENAAALRIIGTYELANGNTRRVDMAISPNSPIFSNLIDDDGAETVLVEADHVKSLILEFDLSKLFGQVNDGLWISANVSNVNGINTIIVDDYNNTEVGQALLDGFAESLQMKFE